MISFELDDIKDPVARENFRKLNELIESNPVMAGEFKVFEITAEVGTQKHKHNLGYVPRDIVLSNKSDDGATVVVNYAQTDRDWMSFTITGRACTFRVLAGRMR